MSDKVNIIDDCDLASYRKLRLRGLRENPEAFAETATHFESMSDEGLQSRFETQRKVGGFILCARSDGGTVGTVGLARSAGEKSFHRAELWGMYVVPEVRGRGIATQLVNALIARAEQIAGLEQISLGVVTTNDAARSLYEKVGFKTYGTDPRALKVGSCYFDEYLMVRYLKGITAS